LQTDHRHDLRSARSERHNLDRLLLGPAVLVHLSNALGAPEVGIELRSRRGRRCTTGGCPLPSPLPSPPRHQPHPHPKRRATATGFKAAEHPPWDIRAGEYFVSSVVAALRNSPSWNDSILIITYDEHGGFYDHVRPPAAPQGGATTPDGIAPGQCADLSNPPA